MSVEAAADTGSVESLGAPIPVAASVQGAELATKSEPSAVVVTREQTDIERRGAADKALTDDLMKVWDKNHPTRSTDGKFSTKEQETPPTDVKGEPSEAAPVVKTDSADQAPKAKDEPAKPAIDPPLSWSAGMKEKWAALPPDLQTYVSQRDKETHDAISRAGQAVKEHEQRIKGYEGYDQLANAHRDSLVRRGITPVQAFATLLDAQRRLDSDPVSGLVQIGLTYGIDLRPVFQQQGGQPQRTPQDPRVADLEAKLKEMQDWRSAQQSQQAEHSQRAAQAEQERMVKVITDFAKDKPHWSDLEKDVLHEVQVIRASEPDMQPAEVLTKAYDRASWANPDVRQRIQADQRKADEEKRKVEAEKKAAEARKAASVNVKSGSPGSQSPRTMDDTLRETYARIHGRSAA